METSLINRLQLTLLALVTLGLLALAGLNFWQERHSQLPDDGVWWREAANGSGLVADKVLPDTPGERAGIKANDLLTGVSVLPVAGLQSSIKPQVPLAAVKELPDEAVRQPSEEPLALPAAEVKYTPVVRVADLERAFYHTGSYGNIKYQITRGGIPLDTPVEVIPEQADRSLALGMRLIGLIYLAIGIYVLFRRWTAPRATHFYLFCLVSFALYALKYTGALDATGHWDKLDQAVAGSLLEVEQIDLSKPRQLVMTTSQHTTVKVDVEEFPQQLRRLGVILRWAQQRQKQVQMVDLTVNRGVPVTFVN